MAIHFLRNALLPHRVAGGVGLLLIGAGVASATYRVARPAPPISPARESALLPDVLKPPGIPQTIPREAESGSESELTSRSFTPTRETLPPFRVTDISASLQAGEKFDLVALSHNSAVLGTVVPPGKNSGIPGARREAPRTGAALWQDGKLYRLPIPAGAHRVVAGDINDNGDVGALSVRYRRGKPPYCRVLIYPRGGAWQDLGTIDPQYAQFDTTITTKMRGVSEELLCLNNRRTLIALVGNKSWFRRSDGAKAPLGSGIAFDLNNNDTVVGFVGSYSGGAAMWRNATEPARTSLRPLLPGQTEIRRGEQQPFWRGAAQCLNDLGDTVITVPMDSTNGLRRMGRTAYYCLRNGKLQLIAQMRGNQRTRVRINDLGDVIGMADTEPATQTTSPYLYRDGKMYDLTGAARDTGWTIVTAIDINNRRQILAYGVHKDRGGVIVPLLLTPAPAADDGVAASLPRSATAGQTRSL